MKISSVLIVFTVLQLLTGFTILVGLEVRADDAIKSSDGSARLTGDGEGLIQIHSVGGTLVIEGAKLKDLKAGLSCWTSITHRVRKKKAAVSFLEITASNGENGVNHIYSIETPELALRQFKRPQDFPAFVSVFMSALIAKQMPPSETIEGCELDFLVSTDFTSSRSPITIWKSRLVPLGGVYNYYHTMDERLIRQALHKIHLYRDPAKPDLFRTRLDESSTFHMFQANTADSAVRFEDYWRAFRVGNTEELAYGEDDGGRPSNRSAAALFGATAAGVVFQSWPALAAGALVGESLGQDSAPPMLKMAYLQRKMPLPSSALIAQFPNHDAIQTSDEDSALVTLVGSTFERHLATREALSDEEVAELSTIRKKYASPEFSAWIKMIQEFPYKNQGQCVVDGSCQPLSLPSGKPLRRVRSL